MLYRDLCCRRRNGFACGIYASAFMWWRSTDKWRFYCHMAYWLLDKEDHLYKQLAKYFGCERNDGICPKGMSQQFGFRQDQECNWDDLGCGCIFRPWKDGDSKVVELTRRDGSITCFRAARLPEALDNAIKQDQETFYKALGLLTHEDILQAIPMVPQGPTQSRRRSWASPASPSTRPSVKDGRGSQRRGG